MSTTLRRPRRLPTVLVAAAAVTATALVSTPATAAPIAGVDPADTAPRVVILDVQVPVEGQEPLAAWLVKPARPEKHSAAAVLWMHWLGEIHSDRSEFLSEAVDLAGEGTISLLPQGTLPWTDDPVGDERDVTAVKAQTAAYEAGLDFLLARPGVDRSRVAVVGHDYGSMYGALVADRDHRVGTMVMAAPDATWGNWFAKYWLGLEGAEAQEYAELFEGLDPVDHVSRLGSDLMLQWAGNDDYVPEEVRDAYAAAAPDAVVKLYPGVDHEFTTRAQIDRLAFLRSQLDLG
jgi:dienelactone hydrolase